MDDFEDLDYYELLGVSRAASADEIKRAYRREISKYHPDRFAGAPPEEQAYASLRSQQINEAYRVLTDFGARNEYNRAQSRPVRAARRPPQAPQPRDHQAELYEQAQAHLRSGRPLQAIAVLRDLQRINPLYRDSAELMDAARAQVDRHMEGSGRIDRPALGRRALIVGGAGGAVAAVALLAWAFGRTPSAPTGVAASSATSTPAPLPTTAPLPTEPPAPAPTSPPTVTPEPSPSVTPRPSPTTPPSMTPEPSPTTPPTPAGRVVLSEPFSTRNWADLSGRSWSVGYSAGRYRVAADAGAGTIWSFRTGPRGNVAYAVDAQIVGEGGLMLRFDDDDNYLTYSLIPDVGAFRVILLRGGRATTLAEGRSPAIQTGADAINRLDARFSGDTLWLTVNGQELTEVSVADAPASPRYGLVAIASNTASEVLFDNLEIRTFEP